MPAGAQQCFLAYCSLFKKAAQRVSAVIAEDVVGACMFGH
jgi:hypothetical protein